MARASGLDRKSLGSNPAIDINLQESCNKSKKVANCGPKYKT